MNRYDKTRTSDLEKLRDLTLQRLTRVPAFRRGSLQQVWRRCGKPNCHCAQPGDQGHGPRWQWTRSAKNDTRGQVIPPNQLPQVRTELDAGTQFNQIVDDLVEVNEVLCRRMITPLNIKPGPKPAREKGGSKTRRS